MSKDNSCEICCQVQAGRLTACLIHDFDEKYPILNACNIEDGLTEYCRGCGELKREHVGYQALMRPPCIANGCTNEHAGEYHLCPDHLANIIHRPKDNDEHDYSWIKVKRHINDPTKSWEEQYKMLEKHHEEETKFLINEIEMLKEQVKRSRERNGGLLGVVEEIKTAKNFLDGALITLNSDIEAARKRDEEVNLKPVNKIQYREREHTVLSSPRGSEENETRGTACGACYARQVEQEDEKK